MLEPKPKIPSIPPLENAKSPHLKEGVKPIIVCVGTVHDFPITDLIKLKLEGMHAKHVHYHESVRNKLKMGFLGQSEGWNISSLDRDNKDSDRFYNCVGLIVSGREKITGKEISFLSHNNAMQFEMTAKKSLFKEDLDKILNEVRDQCEDGTIDALILGGKWDRADFYNNMYYSTGVRTISEEVDNILGFKPLIVNGPKVLLPENEEIEPDYLFYDTEKRRLYFLRPEVNPETGTFIQESIDEASKPWRTKKE